MRQHHFFSIACIFFLFNSCASIPVATMKPINKNTTFDWGSEVVTFRQDDLFLKVAYIRSTDDHFLFDVEVQNASKKTQLVAPEDFFYQIMLSDTLEPLENRFPAVDPEGILLDINKAEARENADGRTSYLLEFTSAMSNTASDIANINRERTQEEIEEAERNQRRNKYELEKIERMLSFQSLNERRSYWENKMFRKTHVPHGYSLKGRVAFYRFNNKNPLLKFTFPIGKNNFEVIYQQKLIDANSVYE